MPPNFLSIPFGLAGPYEVSPVFLRLCSFSSCLPSPFNGRIVVLLNIILGFQKVTEISTTSFAQIPLCIVYHAA